MTIQTRYVIVCDECDQEDSEQSYEPEGSRAQGLPVQDQGFTENDAWGIVTHTCDPCAKKLVSQNE